MGDTWEDAAEAVVKGDKWDEEADNNVKDSWDCEDEASEVVVTAKPAAPKPKKAVQAKSVVANNGFVEVEGEGEWERKKRLEQIQKDRDLDVAMDLLGISEMRKGPPHPEAAIFAAGPATSSKVSGEKRPTLDISHLNAASVTVVDMDGLAEQIIKGLQPISTSKHYPHLLEVLCRGLLQTRDVTEVRRLASVMQDLVTVKNREKLERDRVQAAATAAAASKKPQATLGKKGGKFDMNDYGDVYDDDDDY